MFELIGHPVSKLRRVAIGPIRDTSLPTGATRALTGEEVRALKKSLAEPPRDPAATAVPRSGPAARRKRPMGSGRGQTRRPPGEGKAGPRRRRPSA